MQLSLNIKNEEIMEKLLWMLEHFKNDGVEIIDIDNKYTLETYKKIKNFNFNINDSELITFKERL
ncbi:MAG: hypothetical protein U9N42_02210 [Campylobacterota bacterium]|nr:hypothetical protein [Campylobacterota bacterium]